MKDKIVITIGRQFGSGGREIGKLIAEKLGINFYDKELISIAAKQSGLCEQIFETHDEKPTSSFLYSLVMDTYSLGYGGTGYMDVPVGQKVFLAQFDAIKKIAENESCVIVQSDLSFPPSTFSKDSPTAVPIAPPSNPNRGLTSPVLNRVPASKLTSHICHFHYLFSPAFSMTGIRYSVPFFNIP